MPRSKKIVIADDNSELCELMVDVFKECGYEADYVSDGYELISYLESQNPALIILDLMMPDKDGVSIIDSIKRLSPYARIIIYTGYREYQKSVYAKVVDRFILKGGSIKNLVKAVEELL